MKVTYTGQNKAREYDGVDKPNIGNYVQRSVYESDLLRYKAHIATLQEYPVIGEHSWQEGKVYEEGVDFATERQWKLIAGDWLSEKHLTEDDFHAIVTSGNRIVIRPFEPKKQEEKQGEEVGAVRKKWEKRLEPICKELFDGFTAMGLANAASKAGSICFLLAEDIKSQLSSAQATIQDWVNNWNQLDKLYQAAQDTIAELRTENEGLRQDIKGQVEQTKDWEATASDRTQVLNDFDDLNTELQATIAEQAKEIERLKDLVASDNKTSTVPCDAPVITSNSVEQEFCTVRVWLHSHCDTKELDEIEIFGICFLTGIEVGKTQFEILETNLYEEWDEFAKLPREECYFIDAYLKIDSGEQYFEFKNIRPDKLNSAPTVHECDATMPNSSNEDGSQTDSGNKKEASEEEEDLFAIEADLREYFTKNKEDKGGGYAIRVLKYITRKSNKLK